MDFLGGCRGGGCAPPRIFINPPQSGFAPPKNFFHPPPKDTINGQNFSLFNNLFNTIRKYTGHRIIHNFFLSSFDLSAPTKPTPHAEANNCTPPKIF